MGKVIMYGASDDLIYFDGISRALDSRGKNVHGQDKDNYAESRKGRAEYTVILEGSEHAEFVINDRLHVRVRFGEGGWTFEPGYGSAEGQERPPWPVSIFPDPEIEHTSRVVVEMPVEIVEVCRVS